MARTPFLLRRGKTRLHKDQRRIIVMSNLAWLMVVGVALYYGSVLWALPALVTMCMSMTFHSLRYRYLEIMDTFFAAWYFLSGTLFLIYIHPLSELQAVLFLAMIALSTYFLAHVFRIQHKVTLYTFSHATWHVSSAVFASGVYWTLLR